MRRIIIFLSLFVIFNVGNSQHRRELKLNHCIWKFKDCGQVLIDGEPHKVRGMNYIDYESLHEITMYTYSGHVVTVQRTSTLYYFNVLYPNGNVTCNEYPRDLLTDWVFKVFVLP